MSSRITSYGEFSARDVPRWLPLLLLIPFVVSGLVDLPRVITFGSITSGGLLSMAELVLAAGALLIPRAYPRMLLLRFLPYGLFLGWIICRSAIEAPNQGALQNGLAYLLFGAQFLLAGTLAAKNPEVTLSMLRRGFLLLDFITLPLIAVSFLRYGLPSESNEGIWLVGPRSVALLAIVPVSWHLSGWCHGRPRAGIRALAWILAVLASLSRTATAVVIISAALAFIAHLWITPRQFVRQTPVVAMGAALVALLLVSYGPTFYTRFFEGYNNVEVGGVAISTSGRNMIWPTVIASAKRHPVVGGGLGSSQESLSEFETSVVGHPHNDYLRVWHDGGVVGLVFFLLALFLWLSVLGPQWVRAVRTSLVHPEVDMAALLTLIGVMLAAITDNIVVYTHVMAPSGLLIGAALGLRAYDHVSVRARYPEIRIVA